MEPNAGPNRTQTVPRNSQHGIWTSHHKAICNLWGVNWSLTWNPSGFSGVVLANSMLVTFGRPYFSFHIALTIKKLFGFQVCGGERTETKAPPRKGRDLFFDMCWVPCSSRNLPKWAATGRKLGQWREKKQATWKDNKKDNKNQQTKKESGKSNKEQKTNVTIWWWTCWSCHGAPKVNFVGFHVGFRCEFDDHTRGTQQVGGGEPDQGEHTGRQNVATAQKRPSGTFSPLPNVKEN